MPKGFSLRPHHTFFSFMKLVSKKLSLVLAGAALLFAGCTKKPIRPDPSGTMGPNTGGASNLADGNVAPLPTTIPGSELANRDPFGMDGQNREALAANTVYFEYDQSSIKPSEREKLKNAKTYLDTNPGQRLLLEGHCDWRGTAEYNLGLGDRRSNAVKKYLLSIGVPADRIETVSKGSLEAKPNATAQEMEKDRRVDLVALKAGAPAAYPAAATAPATK
jgi:peptidoglycan-associated lipoprotein